jgi:ketosteroid isomerase-like protein
MTETEKEVRQVSDDFYRALNDLFHGDVMPMERVWSHAADASNLGPLGGRQYGWEQIRHEFEREAQMHMEGHIEPRDIVIHVSDDLAFAIGTEHGENTAHAGKRVRIDHRATNIFRRENGAWKLIHHHTDIAPALMHAAEE